MTVPASSPLVGRSMQDVGMRREYGVNALSVRRGAGRGNHVARLPFTTEAVIEAGDELELRGDGDALERVREDFGLELDRFVNESDAVMAEVLLMPRSRLIGRTLVDASFRTRFGVNVLSLRREGRSFEGDIAVEPLRFADTLLVAASPSRIEDLRRETNDFVVVAQSAEIEREEIGRASCREREWGSVAALPVKTKEHYAGGGVSVKHQADTKQPSSAWVQ